MHCPCLTMRCFAAATPSARDAMPRLCHAAQRPRTEPNRYASALPSHRCVQLCRCDTLSYLANAKSVAAVLCPRESGANLCRGDARRCHATAMPVVAMPVRGYALPLRTVALLCLCGTSPCCAYAVLMRAYADARSKPPVAHAMLCGHRHAQAKLRAAMPLRGLAVHCLCGA